MSSSYISSLLNMHWESTKKTDENADENFDFGKKWRMIEGYAIDQLLSALSQLLGLKRLGASLGSS